MLGFEAHPVTRLRAALLAGALGGALAAVPVPAGKEASMSQPVRLADHLVLEQADGTPLNLGELVGKRVLLVTWASW